MFRHASRTWAPGIQPFVPIRVGKILTCSSKRICIHGMLTSLFERQAKIRNFPMNVLDGLCGFALFLIRLPVLIMVAIIGSIIIWILRQLSVSRLGDWSNVCRLKTRCLYDYISRIYADFDGPGQCYAALGTRYSAERACSSWAFSAWKKRRLLENGAYQQNRADRTPLVKLIEFFDRLANNSEKQARSINDGDFIISNCSSYIDVIFLAYR